MWFDRLRNAIADWPYSRRALPVRRLQARYRSFLDQDEWPSAIPLIEQSLSLVPGNPDVLYDLACALARAGQPERAVQALGNAAKAGLLHAHKHAQEDSDLETVRDMPGYFEALAALEQADALFEVALKDPYAHTTAAPCPRSGSVRGISRHFDTERRRLRAFGRTLGPWPGHAADWRLLRGKIDALRDRVDGILPGPVARQAWLEIVRCYGRLHKPFGSSGPVRRATFDRMRTVVDEFARRWPDTRELRAARCLLLQAEWDAELMDRYDPATRSSRLTEDLLTRFHSAFTALAEASVGEETEGFALVEALSFHDRAKDPVLHDRLAARLVGSMRRYRAVRNKAWENVRSDVLRMNGTPRFSGRDTEGRTRTLESYRGKLLILDFHGTWCGPCRHELPAMRRLTEQYGPLGVELLGIAMEDGATMPLPSFREWCRKENVNWPQIYSPKGWKHPIAQKFHIRSVPCLLFIDRSGRVVGNGVAAQAEAWLREELKMPAAT